MNGVGKISKLFSDLVYAKLAPRAWLQLSSFCRRTIECLWGRGDTPGKTQGHLVLREVIVRLGCLLVFD